MLNCGALEKMIAGKGALGGLEGRVYSLKDSGQGRPHCEWVTFEKGRQGGVV